LITTPSCSIILFFWSVVHVSGILRIQQVGAGDFGKELVWVEFAGPVVL
jgi:hypothetical protein